VSLQSGGVNLAYGAQYNAAGQITQWKEGADDSSSTAVARTYHAQRGWLTGISVYPTLYPSYPWMSQSYSYLDNGRVQTATEAFNAGLPTTTTYQYDSLDRLTQAVNKNYYQVTQWQLNWTYDEFGNRLTQTRQEGTPVTPPLSSTLSYNNNNRITSDGNTYDLNGNLTAMPGMYSMVYDVFDRLIQAITTPDYLTTTAKYDAFGRRVEQVRKNGDVWVSFHDTSGRLLTTYPGPNQVYFAGQRLGQYTDRLGSVRYQTGSIFSSYFPYGEPINAPAAYDGYKFAQLNRDGETGLDYATNRYYSSAPGRFLTHDPSNEGASVAASQSQNRYSYTLNDPTNLQDPCGLAPLVLSCLPGYDMSGEFGEPQAGYVYLGEQDCLTRGGIVVYGGYPGIDQGGGSGGGPSSGCRGPGTRKTTMTPFTGNLCNPDEQFVEEWSCPSGCTREQCNLKAADYSVDICHARGPSFSAHSSGFFYGFNGWSRYVHCCVKKTAEE
jgi:RHS repeat-associated protein